MLLLTPAIVLSALQVLDVLTAAGIGQHDEVLPLLFRARKVHESLMPYFYQALELGSAKPASHAFLLDVARRGKIMALARSGRVPHEALALAQLSCTGTVHYAHAIGTLTLWTYHAGELGCTHSHGISLVACRPMHMCSCMGVCQCHLLTVTFAFPKQAALLHC